MSSIKNEDSYHTGYIKGQWELLWELIDEFEAADLTDFDLAVWLDKKRGEIGKLRDANLADMQGKYEL